MSISRRLAGLGMVAGLLVGFIAGAGVVSAQHGGSPATPSPHVPTASAPATGAPAAAGVPLAIGAPAGVTSNESTTASGAGPEVADTSASTGVAYAQPAIAYPAYPVYPGNPGVAPDHTIVVVGVGQADLKADGSDRASAERTAIAAAMSDARAQAEAVAAAGSLTLQGTVSVSVSASPFYPILPLEGGGNGQTAPGAGPVSPPSVILPIRPNQASLTVSVTVAYRIG